MAETGNKKVQTEAVRADEAAFSKTERHRMAEQRKQDYEKRKERKISLAQEAGSRVLRPQCADTHRVLNLLEYVDRGRTVITQNFMSSVGFGAKEITPLLENWNNALGELYNAGMAICEKAGVPTDRLRGWKNGVDAPATDSKAKK
ncbi:MAG: hypothetical protein IEMM0002_1063 [bacterium]|nr:MAG: hypothetical protein IEMM0002_1063 [bacterium]